MGESCVAVLNRLEKAGKSIYLNPNPKYYLVISIYLKTKIKKIVAGWGFK